jgi:hypothetical protein
MTPWAWAKATKSEETMIVEEAIVINELKNKIKRGGVQGL